MYSQDWKENLTPIQIDGTTIVSINLDLELERAERMRPLLMKHGHVFETSPFDYRKYTPTSETMRCYDAAVKMAKNMGLVYVEGVVIVSVGVSSFPYCHGWCCTPEGEIVDPTMARHQHKNVLHYVGVPIRLEYVEAQFKETGYYGLLDGRHDGAKLGIYYDDSSKWFDGTIEEKKIERIFGPK